jgi:hypothetical protein
VVALEELVLPLWLIVSLIVEITLVVVGLSLFGVEEGVWEQVVMVEAPVVARQRVAEVKVVVVAHRAAVLVQAAEEMAVVAEAQDHKLITVFFTILNDAIML